LIIKEFQVLENKNFFEKKNQNFVDKIDFLYYIINVIKTSHKVRSKSIKKVVSKIFIIQKNFHYRRKNP